MRARKLVAAVAVAGATAMSLVACEDGPTQVYQPSPAGAGAKWNDGHGPGTADGTSQPFQVDDSGTNKQELCTGDQKAQTWAAMMQKPIIPPTTAAGLDLSGGPSWTGLTIETAEKLNCQSDSDGDLFGDGNQDNSWGDNGEVSVEYLVSTRKIDQITLWPGYLGAMDFKSRDGRQSYHLTIGNPIQKNGEKFPLDWTATDATFPAEVDELYLAMMATYAPSLPSKAGCLVTGSCITGSFGDAAYLYIPVLGWGLWVDNIHDPIAKDIATRIDLSPAKVLPFAYANPEMKLDAEGPVAAAGLLGHGTRPCLLKMGQSYADFLGTCVQVDGDPARDQVELNKLIGGITHSTERFEFDVQGIDLNFSDRRLGATDIIRDADRPAATDVATEFSIDQSTLGRFVNDLDAQGNMDLHGAGAVYREYARLVRTQLLAEAHVADGDLRACLFPPNFETDPKFDPAAFVARLPAWCTGFEGFITAAPPTTSGDANNLGMKAISVTPNYALGMKLGHQQATFCMDATGDLRTDAHGNLNHGYQVCAGPWGATGDIFATSFNRVVQFFGKGEVLNLPVEVRDVRFFFKQYVIALVKYLTVGSQNPVPELRGVAIDLDDLFFDSEGSGQFEIGEYVDRRFASKTQNPIDFVIGADVKNGIFSTYSFSRDLYRGEEALYQAILESPSDGLGQEENALLTNIFGSPALRNGWHDSASHDAYYCATHLDPNGCDQQRPPLDRAGNVLVDDAGRPILQRYPGAFGEHATAFALGPTGIKVKQTFPALQQALVTVPTTTDPYDPQSGAGTPIETLVPWVPKQPGVGFPLALTGTLDKFIETSQLDFSGTTISANVDYGPEIDPATGAPSADGTLRLLAVETTDFLGDVFLCQDPSSGDLLRARMYTPVQNIMDWLASHPDARQACGIVVRYSPFNNYVDFITSLRNGVRLGVTQGGGFGRVVDVTLFVPGQ
jgi:hypothetical protein